MADKPKPTLRIQSSEEERRVAHQEQFEAWVTECEAMQMALIEGLLAYMPSLQAGG